MARKMPIFHSHGIEIPKEQIVRGATRRWRVFQCTAELTGSYEHVVTKPEAARIIPALRMEKQNRVVLARHSEREQGAGSQRGDPRLEREPLGEERGHIAPHAHKNFLDSLTFRDVERVPRHPSRERIEDDLPFDFVEGKHIRPLGVHQINDARDTIVFLLEVLDVS